jgi:hypothetical protein
MIPERYRAKCEYCGQEVDVRAEGSHQHVSGWVKNRSGGGGHGVSVPVRANRWAHSWCVDSASRGTLTQGSMFK